MRLCVSIHAPRAGRDKTGAEISAGSYVSIHAPRAGRDWWMNRTNNTQRSFNPRAPRGARLEPAPTITRNHSRFQSTRPARGATVDEILLTLYIGVSIHAPRAGRDNTWHGTPPLAQSFNPRAPRGARLANTRHGKLNHGFNPRAPRGARPLQGREEGYSESVSIHAPRAGRDPMNGVQYDPIGAFQSTRPARGATGSRLR